jgi:dihydrofolate reductase
MLGSFHEAEGVLLLGRSTWQLFSRLWPGRDDPFSARMNAVPKLVASRALTGCLWRHARNAGLAVVLIDADHHDQELDAIGFAARA